MNNAQRYLKQHWFWIVVNCAALLPLLWLVWDIAQGNLSANPIDDITDRTGKAALILLMLSLACTPVNTVFGFKQALTVRKALGMFAFVYASIHLLIFVGLDYGFDLALILDDALLTKPYILVGLAAFLILVPLAITSTRRWMKRLGQNWKRLHRLVYLAGVAVVLHFLWLAKAAEDYEPLTYGLILAVLLLLRVPAVRRAAVNLRQRVTGNRQSTATSAVNPSRRTPAGRRPNSPKAILNPVETSKP
jgi:sulfoxide reductase heme-binding subunit YedZ